VLLQALAVVASFQLSTAGHFVSDVVQLLAAGHHHHDAGDDEDNPDHDCPPGCPNCHHVHMSGAAVPCGAVATLSGLPAAGLSSPRRPVGDDTPQGPHLPSVYRPPRS
jgi:hypothetical protein